MKKAPTLVLQNFGKKTLGDRDKIWNEGGEVKYNWPQNEYSIVFF